jgi:hypothetical protein
MLHTGQGRMFDGIAYDVKWDMLTQAGYLAPLRYKPGSTEIDSKTLKTRAGEFKQGLCDVEEATRAMVFDLTALRATRKKVLVFCVDIESTEYAANALRAAGFAVAPVTNKTSKDRRDLILKRFKATKAGVVVNANILTTGFDVPDIDCICMLRATKSPSLFVQMIGRGARIAPGKTDCLVLDYGENVQRFGKAETITITDPAGDGSPGVAPHKYCQECGEPIPIVATACPYCAAVQILNEDEEKYSVDIGISVQKTVDVSYIQATRQRSRAGNGMWVITLLGWDMSELARDYIVDVADDAETWKVRRRAESITRYWPDGDTEKIPRRPIRAVVERENRKWAAKVVRLEFGK